jgi:hypothetical protein
VVQIVVHQLLLKTSAKKNFLSLKEIDPKTSRHLSCLENNPPENNVKPVPANSELPPKQSAKK